MQRVNTHVYAPKSSTACTTSLKNTAKTLGLAPSRHRILASWAQLFYAFFRLTATADQFSSAAIKTCPRYLKEVTILSGLL